VICLFASFASQQPDDLGLVKLDKPVTDRISKLGFYCICDARYHKDFDGVAKGLVSRIPFDEYLTMQMIICTAG
jgi:hypothetical protein